MGTYIRLHSDPLLNFTIIHSVRLYILTMLYSRGRFVMIRRVSILKSFTATGVQHIKVTSKIV